MRSLLGRFHRPNARSQTERLVMLNNLGDGSTLSLDFTSGVLDPRFTFSRSTTATFINSQGLVQYADHNLFTNTAWLGSTLPTNWNVLTGTGTITWNANGSVTMTAATSQRPAIYHSTITNINPGMPHTFGYLATGVSGSPQISQIINSTISGETYAINGVTVASSTVVQSNDVVSSTFTPTTTTVTLRIGPGSTGPQSSVSVTASRPQFNVGSSLQPYAANTSTTATYQAPRFDYDPTTLAPRGLLLEGSATNLALRSDDFNTTVTDGTQWAPSGYTAGTLSTTLPDGTTGNARRISVASGSGSFRSQAITVTANTAYTWSFWARNNGGSQARYRVFNISGSANIVDYTLSGSNYVSSIGGAGNTSSTWVRVSVSFTTPALCTSVFVYPSSSDSGTVDLLVWGAQLELGSGGASSYISTVASTVQRASEVMYMDGTNFSAWWPSGQSEYSVYFAGDIARTPATTQFMWLARTGSGGTGISLARHFVTTASSIRANNTVNDLTSSLTATVGTRFRAAFAVKSGDSALHVNNGTTTASVTASDTGLATTAAQIVFNPNSDVFQHIASLTFWPIRLPNATLQSLIT